MKYKLTPKEQAIEDSLEEFTTAKEKTKKRVQSIIATASKRPDVASSAVRIRTTPWSNWAGRCWAYGRWDSIRTGGWCGKGSLRIASAVRACGEPIVGRRGPASRPTGIPSVLCRTTAEADCGCRLPARLLVLWPD